MSRAGKVARTAAAALGGCVVLAGCSTQIGAAASPAAVGNPAHGAALIGQAQCGACHEIPGIADAHGLVGPPLVDFGRRTMIAGMLPNTPDQLVYWLRNPQAVTPGNGMPDTGLSDRDARDVAAYLYTLR
jgi:cytochrome c1